MNALELVELVENHPNYNGEDVGEFIYESTHWDSRKENIVEGIGDIRMVEQVGGEGEGDHAHIVFTVNGEMFRIDGYHQSYDGTYYDGEPYAVKPKIVERTEYVKV